MKKISLLFYALSSVTAFFAAGIGMGLGFYWSRNIFDPKILGLIGAGMWAAGFFLAYRDTRLRPGVADIAMASNDIRTVCSYLSFMSCLFALVGLGGAILTSAALLVILPVELNPVPHWFPMK